MWLPDQRNTVSLIGFLQFHLNGSIVASALYALISNNESGYKSRFPDSPYLQSPNVTQEI